MRQPTIIKFSEKNIWQRMQILIDFYNLHIEIPEDAQELAQHDQEKLRAFLEKYLPTLESELNIYRMQHKKDWFASEHALELLKRLHFLYSLVEAYINDALTLKHLIDLNAFLNEFFRPTLLLERRGPPSKSLGRELADLLLFGKTIDGKKVTLKTWQPSWTVAVPEPTLSLPEIREKFGIDVRVAILWELGQAAYWLLRLRWPVRRCAFPGCHNIFIPHPQTPRKGELVQKFCPRCKKRRKPPELARVAK